ncbi:MAG TPA: alpha-1,2-fucosyltransferase, partial [Acidimicrobiales bacterium]|nr:alpha-1,2-fucosyltransferase [Acidimicrobiales bacterium]
VIVFSDDPDWCRANLSGIHPAAVLEAGRDVVDLAAMALCEHHIIANSSFSYWGAMLAQDPSAVHIHPDRWYGPGHAIADPSLLLPPGWIAVDPWLERTWRGRLFSPHRRSRQIRSRWTRARSARRARKPTLGSADELT